MTYSLIRSFGKNNRLSLFLCFSLFSNSFLLGTDTTCTENSTVIEIDTTKAATLNELYVQYNEQLNTLTSILLNLAHLIGMQKITPTNPTEVHEWLHQIYKTINKARKLPYATLTDLKLIYFFNFNKIIVTTIETAYQSNFDTCASAEYLAATLNDLEANLQIEPTTNMPLQVAANHASESDQAIDSLASAVNKNGSSWYNHVYRKMAWINRNFHVASTAVTVASLAALTHAVIMLTPKRYFLGSFNPQNDTVVGVIDFATAFGLGVAGIQGLNSTFNLADGMAKLWNDFDAFIKGSTPDDSKNFIKYVDDLTLDDPMFDCMRDKFGPYITILKFIENPDLYINTKTDIPNYVLLRGKPGIGKVLSSRALAGSINKLLKKLGYSEKCYCIEIDPWSLPEIDDIIKQTRSNTPSVIFIDDFHLFAGDAQMNSNATWLSNLFTEINNVNKLKDRMGQIFVIAATNYPDLIASRLLKYGYFTMDTWIEF